MIAHIFPGVDADDIARVRIFNVRGEVMQTLVNDYLSEGRHSLTFDGASLKRGMYFLEVLLKHDAQCRLIVVTK